MTRVMYDGKRLIPTPFVSIQKQYTKAGDGEIIGSIFNISLQGTIVAFKGSPDASGNFFEAGGYPDDEIVPDNQRLASLMRKQEAIRDLFSAEGRQLEIQSLDASQPMKCNPRVNGLSFEEGTWYNVVKYSVNLESDILSVDGLPFGEDNFAPSGVISEASEAWTLETDEGQPESLELNRTYRLTHAVSARGKRFYDSAGALIKPAWHQARDYVQGRLGFDSTIALSSGVNNLPSFYGGLNHSRNENLDELGGNYSVTETWIIASGKALETFDIQTSESEESVQNVSINGTITGLEERDSAFEIISTKWDNASTKFTEASGAALARAQLYSGLALNVIARSKSIGSNPVNGTITYNFEYDDRPSNCVAGTKSEVVTITNSWDVDVFAVIPVLGRVAGPVLQDLSMKKEKTTSLSIELVFNMATLAGCDEADWKSLLVTQNPRLSAPSGAIQTIVNGAMPINNGATTQFVGSQNETWSPITGRYSYDTSWIYE